MAENINSGSIKLTVAFALANGDPVLPSVLNAPPSLSKTLSFKTGGTGTVADADKLHVSHRTLGPGVSEVLDFFTTGSLLTPYGAAFGVTKLKGLLILLDASPAVSGLTVEPDATNPLAALWSGTTPADKVPNGLLGGWWSMPPAMSAAGVVVSNTAKRVKVTNNDGALTAGYYLVALGKQ